MIFYPGCICLPLTVEHSSTSNVVGQYEDTVSVHCVEGYITDDEMTTSYETKCQHDKTWSQGKICQRKQQKMGYTVMSHIKFLEFYM